MKVESHQQKVQAQFDPQAEAYLHSRVHSSGPDLLRAQEIIRGLSGHSEKLLLDVGCGAGHLSFALAPWMKQVGSTLWRHATARTTDGAQIGRRAHRARRNACLSA